MANRRDILAGQPCHFAELVGGLGQKLVKRRIQKADGDGEPRHCFEEALEIGTLHRKELGEFLRGAEPCDGVGVVERSGELAVEPAALAQLLTRLDRHGCELRVVRSDVDKYPKDLWVRTRPARPIGKNELTNSYNRPMRR